MEIFKNIQEAGNQFSIKYDENDNKLTFKGYDGYWREYTFDENGRKLSFKDSDGVFEDYRVKQMSKEEAEKKFKIKIVD